VGFSSFFIVPVKPSSMCSPFFVPLQQPTSIMFNPSSTTNHHSHLARIKHVVGLSNQNPTSLTSRLKLGGYEKRPPPEPPPSEEMQCLKAVCVSVISMFIVFYCFCLVFYCVVLCYCVSVISIFKFALIVFDEKSQKCLNAMKNALRKDLNQYLFFSIQQMNPSRVVSLTIFENPYS
jgi:hypothetical protein